MFIAELTIENLRCLGTATLAGLNVPSGVSGSGLNIFIGENGTGKTTVLEAINFLTQSSFTANNTLGIGDFKDMDDDINVSYVSSVNFKCKMPATYRGCFYEANGISFKAATRKSKSPGKLLSAPFQVSSAFVNISPNYKRADGQDSGKKIDEYFKMYSADNIDGDDLNIFYFDKNRTRQLTQGNYRTTFERICDDMNWRFIKTLKTDPAKKQAIIDSLSGDYFQQAKEAAQAGAGQKTADDLAAFFDDPKYKNLKLDIINYLEPFSSGMFAVREDDSLLQIMSRDLGSGIEMIIALLMLRNISGASGGNIIYLIDEPEAHLHPKAQKQLLKLLLEESKDKQVFLSTHSPYMFKDAVESNPGLFVFKRNAAGEVEITDARHANFGHFPWSPSWGEVNFSAYDLPTVELHNELYGHIQEQTASSTEALLEAYLAARGVNKVKQWIRNQNGTPQAPYAVTLSTYIRNSIHHPENTRNAAYSESELRQSISDMLALVEAGL